MALIKNANLSSLEKDYPIDIKRIMGDCKKFKTKCHIDRKDLNKSQENLEEAKGFLQIIMSSLMSKLHDLKLLKSEEERDFWLKLNLDLNRCLGMLDKRENNLITGRDKKDIGIANISAFKTELSTAYFSIIINPLTQAKEEYKKIEKNQKIADKNRAFFYLLYELISISSSTLYGSTRLSLTGSGSGKENIDILTWQKMYFKSMNKELEKLKEKVGKNKDSKSKEKIDEMIKKLEKDEEDFSLEGGDEDNQETEEEN